MIKFLMLFSLLYVFIPIGISCVAHIPLKYSFVLVFVALFALGTLLDKIGGDNHDEKRIQAILQTIQESNK